jgi:hypothetical protein
MTFKLCCRCWVNFIQSRLVAIEDIVRGKWDLIEGTFDDIIQPEVAHIIHLFIVWFEVWLNLRGDAVYWAPNENHLLELCSQ